MSSDSCLLSSSSFRVRKAALSPRPSYRDKNYTMRDAGYHSALDLLLGAQVAIVSTLSLAAVVRLKGKSGVALSANQLITFVRASESCESWLDSDAAHAATAQSEHQVKSRLLLDVVVRKSASVFKLLAGENQSLLIRWDALFVLDLGSAKRN